MEARPLKILDGVLGVFDHTAESFVRMRHVVASIEVVVHVNLPVAIQRVDAAIEILERFGELQRRNEFGDFAQKFPQGSGSPVEIYENEIFPGVHAHRDQAIVGAFEIANSLELDHAFQTAVVAVRPAMIRAPEILRATRRFRHDGGGMMAAHVVKRAQFAIVAANDDQRFLVDVDGEKLPWLPHLVQVADNQPVGCEDRVAFQLRETLIEIPGSGNSPRLFKRIGGVVKV